MKGRSLLILVFSLLLILGLGGGIGGLWEEARAEEPEAPDEARLLASAVGTAFTYQGRLTKDGSPVNETCNFWFSLWDAAESGTQVGSTQLVANVTVSNGLFTVQLNGGGEFGDTPFNGEARWLEMMIRCPAGSGGYVLLDPRQPLTPTPYALALPGLYTQQIGTIPNIIGGYRGNSVTSGVYGATIGGGGWPEYPNRVTDDLGTVGGGYDNEARNCATVSGGGENTASGQASTIGGGYRNEASGPVANVSGGADNIASADSSAIGGGWMNMAGADYATVPGGRSADASHHGQMAYASGAFAAIGDAQTSVYVMRIERTCSPGTWYDLYLDGNTAAPANYPTIASGRTVVFDALVVGRSNAAGGNESAGYWIRGVVENVGGTATLINSSRTMLGEDDTVWDARVATLGDDLFVQVQGNGETIRWVATMRTAEVAW